MKHLPLLLISTAILTACTPAANDHSELTPPERKLFEQASAQRAAGNTEDAIKLYTQAAKLSSGSVEAHIAIAEMLRADNKAAQSLSMLQDALILQPSDARLYMEAGFSHVAKAQYADAINSFDRAIELDKELASAYSGKAVSYDLQGEHENAQLIYAEAKARGLGSPALDNNYALSLIFSGKYAEAIEMLKPHVNSSYATATMKQNIALAYGLKGDVGRAAEYGTEGLDPVTAQQNMEFYKRFTSLNYGSGAPAKRPRVAVVDAKKAVPVAPVSSQNIGFVTDTGRSEQVVLEPKVEVIEMDAKAFEEMMK